jgi:hypothetical protein
LAWRLYGMECTGSHFNVDSDTFEFTAPLDTIVARCVSSKPFLANNELHLHSKGEFSHEEREDIIECAQRCFDALPDVIYNRRFKDESIARILEDDSAEIVNIYLGFDLEVALLRWTTASPRWGNTMIERLFKCWNCSAQHPYFSFSHCRASHFDDIDYSHGCKDWNDTTFFGLLGRFHLGHEYPCCDQCYKKIVTARDHTLVHARATACEPKRNNAKRQRTQKT